MFVMTAHDVRFVYIKIADLIFAVVDDSAKCTMSSTCKWRDKKHIAFRYKRGNTDYAPAAVGRAYIMQSLFKFWASAAGHQAISLCPDGRTTSHSFIIFLAKSMYTVAISLCGNASITVLP